MPAAAHLPARITADDGKHFAGDVARAGWCGQEHESRRDLLGLGWPLHSRGAAKLGDILGGLVGRIERRPYRTGSDGVDPMPRSIRCVASERVKA